MENDQANLREGLEYTLKVGEELILSGNESANKSICYSGKFSADVYTLNGVDKKKEGNIILGEQLFYSPTEEYNAINNERFESLKNIDPEGTKIKHLGEPFEVGNKRFEVLDVDAEKIELKYIGEINKIVVHCTHNSQFIFITQTTKKVLDAQTKFW